MFPGAAGSCTAQPLLCLPRPVPHGKGKAGKSHGQGKPPPAGVLSREAAGFVPTSSGGKGGEDGAQPLSRLGVTAV